MRRLTLLHILALVAATAPAAAAEEPKRSFSISLDNDLFANTDRHYTNGVRFSLLEPSGEVPGWINRLADAFPLFAAGGERRVGYAAGQSMFTPENIRLGEPNPSDRPYAGWLYGSIAVASRSGQRQDTLELDLGIVGPASLADKTQRLVHLLSGATQPRGWDKQLHNEPGVLLSYQWQWRAPIDFLPPGLEVDVTPHARGDVGNVLTQAALGGTLRIGFDLPQDFGPPRAGRSLIAADTFAPARNIAWYVFGTVEGRAVLRNLFLDGNSFRDGPGVDKRPVVGNVQFGIAVTIGTWRLSYAHVISSKEFYGQTSADSFGSFTFSARF